MVTQLLQGMHRLTGAQGKGSNLTSGPGGPGSPGSPMPYVYNQTSSIAKCTLHLETLSYTAGRLVMNFTPHAISLSIKST